MRRTMVVTNSLTGGGAERSMNLVVNELTKRGWPVALVPIDIGPADQVIPLCEVFPLRRQWRGGPLNTISAVWNFNRVVRSWKPDVIVLNCDLPELFGVLLLNMKRLVVLEHSSLPWTHRKKFGKIVRRFLRIRQTTWVAVSSHLTIWPNGLPPTFVLQNPVVTKQATMPKKESLEIKRLVFIGRLSKEKRPDVAIEIALKANLELLIIGSGDLQGDLEAQSLRGDSPIVFSGRLSDPWVEVKPGDLLIVTSEFEGDGLVILEALQNEVPMLLVDIPDLRRFDLPEINYCLNVHDFLSSINSLRNNLEMLRIPRNVSEKILEPRSLRMVGDSWERFLRSL